MKGVIQTILAIILFITGLITYIFFRSYSGELIPFPLLWYFVGILLMIAGAALYYLGLSNHEKKEHEELQNKIAAFKLTSEKIKVDLNHCEVKSNVYTEEHERIKPLRAQAFDAVFDSSKNISQERVYQSVLVFETEVNGLLERFYSEIIDKDEVTLRFLIGRQKETYIYFDIEDGTYYFDMEFLDK